MKQGTMRLETDLDTSEFLSNCWPVFNPWDQQTQQKKRKKNS